MNLIIRRNTITGDDLYQHFLDCGTVIENVNLREHAEKLRRLAETFEAWDADRLAGVCACYMNKPDTGIAYISHIATQPAFRRTGVGKKIIQRIWEDATARGFMEIQLEVHKYNETALAFYVALGFEVIEDRPEKYLMSLKSAKSLFC